jgi:hypothetical protein
MSTEHSDNSKDCGRAILSGLLLDAIAASFNRPMTARGRSFRQFRDTFNRIFSGEDHARLPEAADLETFHGDLAQTDLDRLGERARVQSGKDLKPNTSTKSAWEQLIQSVPELTILTNLNELLAYFPRSKGKAWRLFFSTRPLGATEINQIDPRTQSNLQPLCEWLNCLRGNHAQAIGMPDGSSDAAVAIEWAFAPEKPLIAITSYKTTMASWTGRVTGKPDLSRERFKTLAKLVRSVAQLEPRPHYVVFPELSIPREWVMEVASSLHRSGISLITGVEYEINVSKRLRLCHNSVFMFLRSTDLGYPTYRLIRQDKTLPALEEEADLQRLSNLKLVPKKPFDFGYLRSPSTPRPVFRHGNFHFGALICNELTDIAFRSSFRGRVDALFAVEWNKDLKTFSPLIEATANDVHCFVVQVNNREYGDSRIRVPAKDDWKRDVVRLQGGENDYVVVGVLDVPGLRTFQSHYRSATAPGEKFKPVPTGFVMSPLRSENPLLHERE